MRLELSGSRVHTIVGTTSLMFQLLNLACGVTTAEVLWSSVAFVVVCSWCCGIFWLILRVLAILTCLSLLSHFVSCGIAARGPPCCAASQWCWSHVHAAPLFGFSTALGTNLAWSWHAWIHMHHGSLLFVLCGCILTDMILVHVFVHFAPTFHLEKRWQPWMSVVRQWTIQLHSESSWLMFRCHRSW